MPNVVFNNEFAGKNPSCLTKPNSPSIIKRKQNSKVRSLPNFLKLKTNLTII